MCMYERQETAGRQNSISSTYLTIDMRVMMMMMMMMMMLHMYLLSPRGAP